MRSPAKVRVLALALLVSALGPPFASGQNLFWDANGTTAGTGGSGTWRANGASANNWRSGSATGTLGDWATGGTAFFGGTAGTVTIGANPASADRITSGVYFDVGGYTLEALSSAFSLDISGANAINVRASSGATSITSNVQLSADSTIRNNSTGMLTISGSITNSSGTVRQLTIGTTDGTGAGNVTSAA